MQVGERLLQPSRGVSWNAILLLFFFKRNFAIQLRLSFRGAGGSQVQEYEGYNPSRGDEVQKYKDSNPSRGVCKEKLGMQEGYNPSRGDEGKEDV